MAPAPFCSPLEGNGTLFTNCWASNNSIQIPHCTQEMFHSSIIVINTTIPLVPDFGPHFSRIGPSNKAVSCGQNQSIDDKRPTKPTLRTIVLLRRHLGVGISPPSNTRSTATAQDDAVEWRECHSLCFFTSRDNYNGTIRLADGVDSSIANRRAWSWRRLKWKADSD